MGSVKKCRRQTGVLGGEWKAWKGMEGMICCPFLCVHSRNFAKIGGRLRRRAGGADGLPSDDGNLGAGERFGILMTVDVSLFDLSLLPEDDEAGEATSTRQ